MAKDHETQTVSAGERAEHLLRLQFPGCIPALRPQILPATAFADHAVEHSVNARCRREHQADTKRGACARHALRAIDVHLLHPIAEAMTGSVRKRGQVDHGVGVGEHTRADPQ